MQAAGGSFGGVSGGGVQFREVGHDGVHGSFLVGFEGEEERVAYRTAFVTGMQDQREGYRFDDDRGALVLDESVRGFYRQGYRHGYYRDEVLRRHERQNPAEALP